MTQDPDTGIDPGTVVLVALAELQGMPLDAWTDGPIFDRAVRLDRLRVLMGRAREWIDALELSLIDSMETDDVPVPGIGVLRRGEKWTWTWRDSTSSGRMREDLARAVADDIGLDVATGEIDQMKRNIALAAIRAAYDAIPSFSEIKVAGRRRFGMELTDYRQPTLKYVLTLETADDD